MTSHLLKMQDFGGSRGASRCLSAVLWECAMCHQLEAQESETCMCSHWALEERGHAFFFWSSTWCISKQTPPLLPPGSDPWTPRLEAMCRLRNTEVIRPSSGQGRHFLATHNASLKPCILQIGIGYGGITEEGVLATAYGGPRSWPSPGERASISFSSLGFNPQASMC